MSDNAHTLLHLSAQEDDVHEIYRLVRERGIFVDSTCPLGFTALHLAAHFGNLAAMRALVALGADHSAKNVKGTTPLMLASMLEVRYATSFLLRSGASPNERDNSGATALHKALKHNTNSVELLMQNKADPFLSDHKGKSPLHYAVRHQNRDFVQHLIDGNADVNLQTEEGITALHEAAHGNKTTAVQQLCAAGANVHAVCRNGRTALFLAAFCGHWDVLCALHEFGAKLDVPDASGCTPLYTAAQNRHNDVLLYLIRQNGDLHTRRIEDQSTALHAAVKNGHSSTVLMLCEAMADVNAQDVKGYTPLAFAAQNADDKCSHILRAHNKAAQGMIASFSFE